MRRNRLAAWVAVIALSGGACSRSEPLTPVAPTPNAPAPSGPATPAATAPSITDHPASQSMTSGESVTLIVRAGGTDPLVYQWYTGASGDPSAAIAGGTAAALTVSPVTTTSFWARVSNSAGTADSTTAIVTVSSAPAPAPTPAPPVPPTGSSGPEDEVLALVNQKRAAGATCGGTVYPPAAPLAIDTHLRDAARAHASDMAANNYFSHTSLDGRTFDQRIWQSGFGGGFPIGENIGAGYTTAQAAVDAWMQSAGHCANIMSAGYHSIGIGYASAPSSTYRHYWTQDFGG